MRPGVQRALAILASIPRFTLNAEQAGVWGFLLNDIPDDALIAGAAQLARTSKFPPAPAELIEAAERFMPNSGRLSPAEAWEEVYRARHRVFGRDRPPVWSSPDVERAAEAINWNDPDWLTEQLPTIRAQFERHYASFARTTEATRRDTGTMKALGADGIGQLGEGT